MFLHRELPYSKYIWNRTTRDGHRYYTDSVGNYLPSITSVLSEWKSEWLDEWKKNVGVDYATRISRVAAATGTQLHKACENYLNNIDPFVPDDEVKVFMPQVKHRFNQFKTCLDRIDNIYCQEHMMGSVRLGVSGTVDCIADFDGVLSIIDFKTSKRLKHRDDIINYFLQKTAYAIMFYDMYGIEVKQLVTLISVEGVSEPQVFITGVSKHYGELKEAIIEYNRKRYH